MKSATCSILFVYLYLALMLFCPPVLSIINDSMQFGVVPAVTPVPRKENPALDDFNNFHPISNLVFFFFAKVLKLM